MWGAGGYGVIHVTDGAAKVGTWARVVSAGESHGTGIGGDYVMSNNSDADVLLMRTCSGSCTDGPDTIWCGRRCACTNGTASSGADCTSSSPPDHCVSCNAGYTLNNDFGYNFCKRNNNCSSGTRTYNKITCDTTHSDCSGYDGGCFAGYLIGVKNLKADATTLQSDAEKACDATPDCTHINTATAAGGYYQLWGGGRECTPDEYSMHSGSRLKPLWYSRIVTPMGLPANLYKASDDRTCDPGCKPETTTTIVAPYGQYGKMNQTKGDSGGGGGAYEGGGDDKKTQCSTYKSPGRKCWNASGNFQRPEEGVVSVAPGDSLSTLRVVVSVIRHALRMSAHASVEHL